ncbi:unnamed protein product [Calicophoron daubneyi]|uniref:Major facilitator superfamily (MFS) profile domain-containing protein n=1 Tax=Calicophoron daubneyi TaxID=300641 RepID=A0AAV2SZ82_CALDB
MNFTSGMRTDPKNPLSDPSERARAPSFSVKNEDTFVHLNEVHPDKEGEYFSADEKAANQWLASGDLELVLPETHPEAFVPVAPDGGWSWVVLLASFSSCIIIDGISYSLGLILVEIADHLNSSKSKAALLGSLFLGCYQIIGPIAAALINRFGCRLVASAGAVTAACTFLLSALMRDMNALICTFGLIGGSSFGLIYLPAMISVNLYFNRRRAMANGVAVVGSPLGAIIFGPFTNYLLRTYNWANTLVIFSGLLLNCMAFACLYRPLLPSVRLESAKNPIGVEQLETVLADNSRVNQLTSSGFIRSLTMLNSIGGFAQPLLQESEAEMKDRDHSEIPSANVPDGVVPMGTEGDTKPIQHWTGDSLRVAAGGIQQTNQLNVTEPSPKQKPAGNTISSSIQTTAQIDAAAGQDQPPTAGTRDEGHSLFSNQNTGEPHQTRIPGQSTSEHSPQKKDSEMHTADHPDAITLHKPPVSKISDLVNSNKQTSDSGQTHSKAPEISDSGFILSTPCLNVEEGHESRWWASSVGWAENKPTHRPNLGRMLYQQLLHKQSQRQTGSRKRSVGQYNIPPTIPPIAEEVTNQTEYSDQPKWPNEIKDFSSSVSVAGFGGDQIRATRLKGASPGLSNMLHQSALSVVTNSSIKLQLATIDEKPALVVLPNEQLTVEDYRRPMYRSDIFYSGNIIPESEQAAQFPNFDNKVSSTSIHASGLDFINSQMSIYLRSTPRRQSTAYQVPFINSELDIGHSTQNWYESYLVSLTRIPVPSDTQSNIGPYLICCPPRINNLLFCIGHNNSGDKEDEELKEGAHRRSLQECCLTCIRRLRDRRIPLLMKTSRKSKRPQPDKIDSGDINAHKMEFLDKTETAYHCSARHHGLCSYSAKSFFDVLNTMTDFTLFRIPGYLITFIANFCTVLGICIPTLYVSDLAIQCGIPDNQSFYFLSIMGITSIVGRLLSSWIITAIHIRSITLQTASLLLLGLLIAVMPACTSFNKQAVAFALYGFLSAPFSSLSTIILCELVGLEHLTTAVGLVTLSKGLSNVLGPPIAGIMYEATNSFTLPYLVAGLVVVFSGFLFALIILWPRILSIISLKTEIN